MNTESATPQESTQQTITLVSHKLCPYVQRAAIVLAEKGVEFERIISILQINQTGFLSYLH